MLHHQTRTEEDNARLARLLALVAGAVNAGGFLAVGRYTSHMTGLLSTVADSTALGEWPVVGVAGLGVFCFTAGAAVSSLLVNYSRHTHPHRQWALPVFLEGILIAFFGVYGAFLPADWQVPALGIALLCGLMGLQNAVITKLSGARMRTTHVTGMFTDIGIELGRLLGPLVLPRMVRGPLDLPQADTAKMRLLGGLAGCFLVGGVLGALCFRFFGMSFAFPLALVLLGISAPALRNKQKS